MDRDKDWIPGPNARLCAEHFEPDQFRSSIGSRGRKLKVALLKSDAIPSIFSREKPKRSRKVVKSKDDLEEQNDPEKEKNELEGESGGKIFLNESFEMVRLADERPKPDHKYAMDAKRDPKNALRNKNTLFNKSNENKPSKSESEEVTELKTKIQRLSKELSKANTKISRIEYALSKMFNKDQQESLYCKKVMWSEDTIMKVA